MKSRSSETRDLESKITQILARKPESRSFLDVLISKEGHHIHKLRAKDSSGKWAYYFILVMPLKEEKFMKAINGNGMIDLEEHGTIVASCYGDEPTETVKRMLKDKYGFDV